MRSKGNPRAGSASGSEGSAGAAPGYSRPAAGRRRSFSQRNLALEADGPLGTLLGEALQVPAEEGYVLTHAFHPYPGRFHPALPRTLLAATARPGQRVLDPFMGAGTTLVEALQLGLGAIGSDLNPVAVLVARERTRTRAPGEARRVEGEAHRIAESVEALRGDKHPPRVLHPRQHELARHYAPHLLAELMQWYRLIEAAPGGPVRDTLRAVLSSGVVKFSNLVSDSQAEAGPAPRYGKGAVSRFLVGKAHELVQAQVALGARIPPGTPPAALYQDDARLLPSLGWASCDLVLTSPPYPGTYDYHAQHRLRMDWLGLDAAPFAAGEIGARRHQGGADAAPGRDAGEPRESWSESLRAVLATLGRVLRPGGSLFMVMGDWITGEHAVDAAAMLARTAGAHDWQLASRASVQRDVHSRTEARAFAKRGKWEHLLHFTRPASDEALPEAEQAEPPVREAKATGPQRRPRPPRRPTPPAAEGAPATPQRKRPREGARRIRSGQRLTLE
ncbi:MAG TPA: DNA methyltransferase [bacterium]|nr:DNA methyltransferase [bacterium]